VWRIPPRLVPKNPFVVVRRLTEAQLRHLRTRRRFRTPLFRAT
jgi:hypothetical protein